MTGMGGGSSAGGDWNMRSSVNIGCTSKMTGRPEARLRCEVNMGSISGGIIAEILIGCDADVLMRRGSAGVVCREEDIASKISWVTFTLWSAFKARMLVLIVGGSVAEDVRLHGHHLCVISARALRSCSAWN